MTLPRRINGIQRVVSTTTEHMRKQMVPMCRGVHNSVPIRRLMHSYRNLRRPRVVQPNKPHFSHHRPQQQQLQQHRHYDRVFLQQLRRSLKAKIWKSTRIRHDAELLCMACMATVVRVHGVLTLMMVLSPEKNMYIFVCDVCVVIM